MSRDLFDETADALLTRDRKHGRRPFVPADVPSEPRSFVRGIRDVVMGGGLMAFIVVPIAQQGLSVRFAAPFWLVGLIFIIGFLIAGRGVFRLTGQA